MVRINKNMDRGLQILLKTYGKVIRYGENYEISKEDFELAKKEGYVFDYPEALNHEETYQKLNGLLEQINPQDVADAFLASLATRELQYRSALGSYWYARSIPKHEVASDKEGCGFCNWSKWLENPSEWLKIDGVNGCNALRYSFGGIDHQYLKFTIFDIEEFIKLPKASKKDVEEGKKLLLEMLHCIDDLGESGKAGKYRDYLVKKKIIKANRAEIEALLDNLGTSGILSGSPDSEAPSFYEKYTSAENDARDPKEYFSYFTFPLNHWQIRDNVNKKMFKIVFGFDYK